MFGSTGKQQLRETIVELESVIHNLRSELEIRDTQKDMVAKAFHSNSHLMAISSLETGEYVDVNEAFLRSLKYKSEEVIGKTSGEIQLFTDIVQSEKFIKILSRMRKVKDFQVELRDSEGEKSDYLFSADTIFLGDTAYLLSTFREVTNIRKGVLRTESDKVLREIYNTLSHYIAVFTATGKNSFLVAEFNFKAEEVEAVSAKDIVGKDLFATPLSKRKKLLELLHHVHITGEHYKVAVSENGDESEGYYIAFVLSGGDIVVTWEPGPVQKFKEKKQLKQAELFEQFADMLPEMIFEIDTRGNITYANKKAFSVLGYSKADIRKGLSLIDIIPDEIKKAMKNLSLLKNIEDSSHTEYMAKSKSGVKFPVLAATFPLIQDGNVIGFRGILTDLTDQKNYENEILGDKTFLEQLIEYSPEAIVLTNRNGIISRINPGFTRLFGYTEEEALGNNIDKLIVPEDLKNEGVSVTEMAISNEEKSLETFRLHKDKSRKYVSLVVTSIKTSDNKGALYAIYRDLTENRKRQIIQEILFNISTAALKYSDISSLYPTIKDELGKIWDTKNFYIALYNKESKTLSLPFFSDENDSFYEIPMGKTITGHLIKEEKPILLHEADINKMEDAGEIDLVGTPCLVWMGVPLILDGEIIGAICLQDYDNEDTFQKEDLTFLEFIANQIALAIQRKDMLDKLIAARQKAEEAANAKQQFMSTMSHEIRTPLNEVIGIANLLFQGNPREDQLDLIKTLRFSGNHLLSLVNDVLDFNKMESGKIIFEKTQFDLSEFLEEISRSYSFRSQEKNLSFEIIKAEGLPTTVVGDPIRLNQILSNLLSNALKFTLEGGITIIVKETYKLKNVSQISFAVKDSGIGIEKDKQKLVFERFAQASDDTTRKFGGTGLGLAICKKLVEMQGGTLSLESTIGEGSTFTATLNFEIPRVKDEVIIPDAAESLDGLKGKKVLIAEDNKINFFVANKFLTGWGIEVVHAENGKIALELIENQKFDLVLMDLHMPVMDGVEASRIIRDSKDPEIRDIPIIALTAAIMSETQDKITDIFINDYILKPFKPTDLYGRIMKHIR